MHDMADATRDVLYGVQSVREALRSDERAFQKIIMAEGRRERAVVEVLELAARKGVRVEWMERAKLTQMAGTSHHQGVIGIANKRICQDLGALLERLPGMSSPALLLADGVEDPANLGAMVRSAEVLGFDGVVVPKRRAVGVTAAVVRASAGAAEHLPIAQVGNIVQAIKRLKKEGLWVVGLEASALVPCFEANLRGPVALVVGGEGKGMRRLVREQCDVLVAVPVRGRVSSLNVAAASAVAMYEVMRQRSRLDAESSWRGGGGGTEQ